jgi:dCTP deaminase
MILSNVAIHKALDDGDLIIDPQPAPRFATLATPNCPYDTTSVNLRLDKTLSIPLNDQTFAFDLRQGKIAKFLPRVYEDRVIDSTGDFSLKPGHFILGATKEIVSLPIRKDRPALAARVEGKSSLARCGLIIHFTAPTIHSEFRGTIALEMINLGKNPIILYPDMPICQLIVERVEGIPLSHPSQFQDQTKPTGAKS